MGSGAPAVEDRSWALPASSLGSFPQSFPQLAAGVATRGGMAFPAPVLPRSGSRGRQRPSVLSAAWQLPQRSGGLCVRHKTLPEPPDQPLAGMTPLSQFPTPWDRRCSAAIAGLF